MKRRTAGGAPAAPLRLAAAITTATATSVVAFWLLWGRLLEAGGLNDQIKEYYLADQFAYMAVARNIEAGLPGFFVEPFTTTGDSIAPSGYFWLLGLVSKVPGLTVFGAWNIVGMAMTLGLIAVVIWWAAWVLPGRLAWAIAPVALLVATFQWVGDGGWVSQYGAHAVLWPPLAILNSPGPEPLGLIATVTMLVVVGIALNRAGTARLAWAVGAGAALGVAALSHTYVAMFAALTIVLAVAVRAAWDRGRRMLLVFLGVVSGSVIVAALLPLSTSLSRLAILLIAPVIFLACQRQWRRPYLLTLCAMGAGSVVVASPLLVQIASQAMRPGSFFYLRQESALDISLELPPLSVLGQFLPVWLLGAAAAVALARGPREPHRAWWFAVVTSLLVTTLILTFNGWWGFSQEPYRFLPYGILLMAGTSLPWLWEALTAPGAWRIVAAGVVVLGALTLPTLVKFARGVPGIFTLSQQERHAYERIADLTHRELTLYDGCFRSDLVKVAGGGRVLWMNRGHAIPDHYPEAWHVLDEVRVKTIPHAAELTLLGVRWVVTTTTCDGMSERDLRARFGAPTTLPLENTAALGQPAGLLYEIYKVPTGATSEGAR